MLVAALERGSGRTAEPTDGFLRVADAVIRGLDACTSCRRGAGGVIGGLVVPFSVDEVWQPAQLVGALGERGAETQQAL